MKKILTIGESSRDIFIYCEAVRLAPDIPVPVLHQLAQTENPGMALNVHRNIQSLAIDSEVLTNEDWRLITKTRYMHEKTNHMFFRVDSSHEIKPINTALIDFSYETIVIADYDKGYLSEEVIEFICSNHEQVFLDTKKILGSWARKASFIKINDYEFVRSQPFLDGNLESKIIHTMGPDGCEFQGKRYKTQQVNVGDSSGAGDTFIAALAVKYSETSEIVKSIQFANKSASEVVRQRGVTTI